MSEQLPSLVYYHAKCVQCVRGWQIKTAIDPSEYNTKCVCGGGLKLVKSKEQPSNV